MPKLRQLNMDPSFLGRNVNEGFSGGSFYPTSATVTKLLLGLYPYNYAFLYVEPLIECCVPYLPSPLTSREKKRNEILQLAVLEADMALLDEIDSGSCFQTSGLQLAAYST